MAAAWQNRIVGYGEEAPDQLAANPKNWRIHPTFQQEALRGSLKEIGWIQDVIVNQRTGYVVDGHARVSVAMREGQTSVPVKYVDLSDEEEALVLASLDPIAAMAVADDYQFNRLLEEVAAEDEALTRLLDSLKTDGPILDDADGLRVDHTAKFMEVEAEDIKEKYTDEYIADRYLATSVRQIVLIMDNDQYVDALTRIRALMEANKMETTTEVFFWLLDLAERGTAGKGN